MEHVEKFVAALEDYYEPMKKARRNALQKAASRYDRSDLLEVYRYLVESFEPTHKRPYPDVAAFRNAVKDLAISERPPAAILIDSDYEQRKGEDLDTNLGVEFMSRIREGMSQGRHPMEVFREFQKDHSEVFDGSV